MKARVSVKRTRYPWDPAWSGQWMWRCLAINDCSEWHYDVDDQGFGDNYSDVLRKALAHTEIEHVPDDDGCLCGPTSDDERSKP